MTELEQIKAMLARISAAVTREFSGGDTIDLTVENTGDRGYGGFVTTWTFNLKTGQLLSVANSE